MYTMYGLKGLKSLFVVAARRHYTASGTKDGATFGSLYERIGGAAAVEAAVDLFYDKIMADSRVNYFFEKTDMSVQRIHQKKFLTLAFGGPVEYGGRDMREAHRRFVKNMGLTHVHFDIVVQHLAATLKELNVDPNYVAEVAAIAESQRNDVLNL
eukprot:RCo034802